MSADLGGSGTADSSSPSPDQPYEKVHPSPFPYAPWESPSPQAKQPEQSGPAGSAGQADQAPSAGQAQPADATNAAQPTATDKLAQFGHALGGAIGSGESWADAMEFAIGFTDLYKSPPSVTGSSVESAPRAEETRPTAPSPDKPGDASTGPSQAEKPSPTTPAESPGPVASGPKQAASPAAQPPAASLDGPAAARTGAAGPAEAAPEKVPSGSSERSAIPEPPAEAGEPSTAGKSRQDEQELVAPVPEESVKAATDAERTPDAASAPENPGNVPTAEETGTVASATASQQEGEGSAAAAEIEPNAGAETKQEAEQGASETGTNTASGAEAADRPLPTNLERHIFEGEINRDGRPVGYHHREGGVDRGNFQVNHSSVTPADRHGVYEATWTATLPNGTEVPKSSSFFPDTWDASDVRKAIREAFDNRIESAPRQWQGTTSEGLTIEGYVRGASVADATPDDISTAYPFWEGRWLI